MSAHVHNKLGANQYTNRFTIDISDWPTWACPQLQESPIDKGKIVVKINMRAPVEEVTRQVSSRTVERVLDAAAKRRRAGGGTATGKTVGYVI